MRTNETKAKRSSACILELKVRNHPGVMSHICGLFARRAYNLEGILCLPMANPQHSQMWLRVNADQRLDQVLQQVKKLIDVETVSLRSAQGPVFRRLESFFGEQ